MRQEVAATRGSVVEEEKSLSAAANNTDQEKVATDELILSPNTWPPRRRPKLHCDPPQERHAYIDLHAGNRQEVGKLMSRLIGRWGNFYRTQQYTPAQQWLAMEYRWRGRRSRIVTISTWGVFTPIVKCKISYAGRVGKRGQKRKMEDEPIVHHVLRTRRHLCIGLG